MLPLCRSIKTCQRSNSSAVSELSNPKNILLMNKTDVPINRVSRCLQTALFRKSKGVTFISRRMGIEKIGLETAFKIF